MASDMHLPVVHMQTNRIIVLAWGVRGCSGTWTVFQNRVKGRVRGGWLDRCIRPQVLTLTCSSDLETTFSVFPISWKWLVCRTGCSGDIYCCWRWGVNVFDLNSLTPSARLVRDILDRENTPWQENIQKLKKEVLFFTSGPIFAVGWHASAINYTLCEATFSDCLMFKTFVRYNLQNFT